MGNYVFTTAALLDAVRRDAKNEDSNHDLGGDVIPALVAAGEAQVYDFATNIVPGATERDAGYWRDVGSIDAYHDAHMDLVSTRPVFDLYNSQWPILSTSPSLPPAKFVHGEPGRTGSAIESLVSPGCIVSGGTVRRSVLSPGVKVHSRSEIEDCVLLHGVDVGRGAVLRRAIIDKGVLVPPGVSIGVDHDADRARGFHISEGGVVVLGKGQVRARPSLNASLGPMHITLQCTRLARPSRGHRPTTAPRALGWRAPTSCAARASASGSSRRTSSSCLTPSLLAHHGVLLEALAGTNAAIVSGGAFARIGRDSLLLVVLAPLCTIALYDVFYWWAGRLWGNKIVAFYTRGNPRAARWVDSRRAAGAASRRSGRWRCLLPALPEHRDLRVLRHQWHVAVDVPPRRRDRDVAVGGLLVGLRLGDRPSRGPRGQRDRALLTDRDDRAGRRASSRLERTEAPARSARALRAQASARMRRAQDGGEQAVAARQQQRYEALVVADLAEQVADADGVGVAVGRVGDPAVPQRVVERHDPARP